MPSTFETERFRDLDRKINSTQNRDSQNTNWRHMFTAHWTWKFCAFYFYGVLLQCSISASFFFFFDILITWGFNLCQLKYCNELWSRKKKLFISIVNLHDHVGKSVQTLEFNKQICNVWKETECHLTNLGTPNGHVHKPKILIQIDGFSRGANSVVVLVV